ncbi:MAG: hypothetical protein DMG44_14440 [Acidobacteria bacterium]|nr:MAG: hypothetical protein DMG44_14440 [Acidobacteriota bacterium]
MARDLHNEIAVRRAIDPQSISTNVATVSSIIDRLGFESLEVIIASGTIASGTAVFTTTIDHGESPTLADAAAVPADQLLGTPAGASFTFASPSSQFRIGYIGGKRFVRLTITTTSNAAAALLTALAVLTDPAKVPTP